MWHLVKIAEALDVEYTDGDFPIEEALEKIKGMENDKKIKQPKSNNEVRRFVGKLLMFIGCYFPLIMTFFGTYIAIARIPILTEFIVSFTLVACAVVVCVPLTTFGFFIAFDPSNTQCVCDKQHNHN